MTQYFSKISDQLNISSNSVSYGSISQSYSFSHNSESDNLIMTQRHRSTENSYQQTSTSSASPVDTLPSWLFDIDEFDDVPTDTSIFKELDIDVYAIRAIFVYMLLNPWFYCFIYTCLN